MSNIKSLTTSIIKKEYNKLSNKRKEEYGVVNSLVASTGMGVVKFLTILGKVMIVNGYKEFGLNLLLFLEDYKP